mmetsp:Transcript_12989/g.15241  ORF Transcript_12989/g.15241 Transcript_12989/m.15241 type:complete len:145 (-) Transcript_12989:100-534(-)
MGYKVTHEINHPKMYIVMDEVGGNTSQKGDGHIGGKLLVCGKGMIPQQRVNHKDTHWNLVGLNALSGDPIMCVIIFAGKRHSPCIFQGKEVLCMIRWSPKGSITSEILTDILRELDHLKVFDRSGGKKPFLLLDGHGSRFELPF